MPENPSVRRGYDYLLKLLLIGNTEVGKSCLLLRYSGGDFTDHFIATIGIDFKMKTLQIDGQTVRLQIWDSAGQERFRTITHPYYKGAMSILVVYDVTNQDSFDCIEGWLEQIKLHGSSTCHKVLIGNKIDLEQERVIPPAKGFEIADKYGIPFFEVSAKSNLHVQLPFEHAANVVLRQLRHTEPKPRESLTYMIEEKGEDKGVVCSASVEIENIFKYCGMIKNRWDRCDGDNHSCFKTCFLLPFRLLTMLIIYAFSVFFMSVFLLPLYFYFLICSPPTETKYTPNDEEEEDSCCTKVYNWLWLLSRLLLVLGILVVWPYYLVYYRHRNAALRYGFIYHLGILLFWQIVGIVQAARGWKSNIIIVSDERRERSPPKLQHRKQGANRFSYSVVNFVSAFSLLIELAQLTLFPLQFFDNHGPLSDHWLRYVYDIVFLETAILREYLGWISTGIVLFLITLLTYQLLLELRRYIRLQFFRAGYSSSFNKQATEFFPTTLAGSIIYGNDTADYVKKPLKVIVSFFTDTLFMVVVLHLLRVLACRPRNGNLIASNATINYSSFTCWQTNHLQLTIFLVAISYYLLLSILIAPIFSGHQQEEHPSTRHFGRKFGADVKYVNFYLMLQTCMKCFSLITSLVFIPTIFGKAVFFCTACIFMGLLTFSWVIHAKRLAMSMFLSTAQLQPCNITSITIFKIVEFSMGAWTAICVIIWSNLKQDTILLVMLPWGYLPILLIGFAIYICMKRCHVGQMAIVSEFWDSISPLPMIARESVSTSKNNSKSSNNTPMRPLTMSSVSPEFTISDSCCDWCKIMKEREKNKKESKKKEENDSNLFDNPLLIKEEKEAQQEPNYVNVHPLDRSQNGIN